jgi:amino acid transporter
VPQLDLYNSPSDLEATVDKALGNASALTRPHRHVIGLLAFTGYLALALFRSGFAALFLAVAFYGVLQRWVIEEPEHGELPDAYVWAVITGLAAIATFAIWWWYLGSEGLQTWATHVWLPAGVVSVALAFDRHRRRATATESIGQVLSQARRRRQPPAGPPSGPSAEA